MEQRGSTLGGTLMVAGTTIGAGMLALPIVSASIGLFWSSVLLLALWGLMYFTSLVTFELNAYFGEGISVVKIAQRLLGNQLSFVAFLSMILLFYSLISAYVAGTSEIIHHNIFGDSPLIPLYLISTCIFLCTGFVLYFPTKLVDYSNRIFFAIKMMCFVALLYLLFPHIKPERFSAPQFADFSISSFSAFAFAIPVLFTSFGFHGSIPSIVTYLENDAKKIKKVLFFGSLIPLIIYLLWQTVTIGVLPAAGEHSFASVAQSNNDLGVFISSLSSMIAQPAFIHLVSAFSLLAIITSLLGVSIGMHSFFIEVRNYDPKKSSDRIKAVLWTLCIPLIIIFLYQHIFIEALSFAAIALSILAVVVPVLAVLKIRKQSNLQNYKVAGGFLLLWTALGSGLFVIIIEILSKLQGS